MSAFEHPVTVAVNRPDGTVEHVRVGTAVRSGDSFRLTFGALAIGAAEPAVQRAAPPPVPAGTLVVPPYGRSKGMPVAGATVQDLEYYASGCRRTLGDASKSRWHDKERQLLAAIEAELANNGRGEPAPTFRDEDAPAPRDEDIPF